MVFLLSAKSSPTKHLHPHLFIELARFGQFVKYTLLGPHFVPISAAEGPHSMWDHNKKHPKNTFFPFYFTDFGFTDWGGTPPPTLIQILLAEKIYGFLFLHPP